MLSVSCHAFVIICFFFLFGSSNLFFCSVRKFHYNLFIFFLLTLSVLINWKPMAFLFLSNLEIFPAMLFSYIVSLPFPYSLLHVWWDLSFSPCISFSSICLHVLCPWATFRMSFTILSSISHIWPGSHPFMVFRLFFQWLYFSILGSLFGHF